MGYSSTSKAYRVWYQDTRQIIESRDVLFDEDSEDVPVALRDNIERVWLPDQPCSLSQIAPPLVGASIQAVGALVQPANLGGGIVAPIGRQLQPIPSIVHPQPEEPSSPLLLSLPNSNTTETGNESSHRDDSPAHSEEEVIVELADEVHEPVFQPDMQPLANWHGHDQIPHQLDQPEVVVHEEVVTPPIAPRQRNPPTRFGD